MLQLSEDVVGENENSKGPFPSNSTREMSHIYSLLLENDFLEGLVPSFNQSGETIQCF